MDKCFCTTGCTAPCHKQSWDTETNCGIAENGSKCKGYAQQGSQFCQGHIKLMKEKEKMNNTVSKGVFWIVWGPAGRTNPKCKYAYYESAQSDAERMARVNPGSEFYVMRGESVSVATSVVTNKLVEDCPF